MKKKIFFFLLISLAFFLSPKKIFSATNYWKFPGVMFKTWDTGNTNFGSACPNCGPIGGIFFVDWRRINPASGSVDTGLIENFLNQAKEMQTAPFPDGRRIAKPVLVEISFLRAADGDLTPGWVYQSGASQQEVNCSGTVYKIPPYSNSAWKNAYFNLIKALGDHFEGVKSQYPNLAGFIIATGFDDEAYPVISWCRPEAILSGYRLFLKDLALAASQAFKTIPVYLQSGGEDFNPLITEEAAKYHIGAKSNTLSPCCEHCCFSWVGPSYQTILGNPDYATTSLAHSAVLKTNEAVSWAMEDARFWCYDCPWETYYQWLIPLWLHADWIDWRDIKVFQKMAAAYPSFVRDFVPNYLGKTKANTPGAWIGFRDVHDPTIYPTGGRPKEIVCWQGSTGAACHSHKISDLDFYLRRVGVDESKAVFRENFPGPAQNQPYGFGRALDAGKLMSLKIDNGVWFKNNTQDLYLKVILLNSGSGSLEISFKKSNGQTYKEIFSKGSNLGGTDQFVEVVRNVGQIKFDGSFSGGGDILISTIGDQSIIHLVEIRATGTPPVVTPPPSVPTPTSLTPRPTPTITRVPTLTPTVGPGTPTVTSALSPTPTISLTPTPSEIKIYLERGWNYLLWKNEWPAEISLSQLPQACPYIVFYDGFYSSFLRDSVGEEKFNCSQKYYLFCQDKVVWPINP